MDQASTLGWGAVDLSGLTAGTDLAFLLGNDATLAGVAETRTGAAAGAKTALHLTVKDGIGGALLLDGHPLTGAGGAGGEYGHVPFGDPASQCPCGARGCWDLEVDGRALARLGETPPEEPRRSARQVLNRAPREPRAAGAIGTIVTALAAGIAGLANAHAPEVITLGGLAVPLRAAAPTEFEAFRGGLMTFLRAQRHPSSTPRTTTTAHYTAQQPSGSTTSPASPPSPTGPRSHRSLPPPSGAFLAISGRARERAGQVPV